MRGIKQRYQEADYLNVADKKVTESSFELMNTGFTKIDDSPSAQTGSRRYVGEKSASKSIKGYDWSAPFEMDMIESQAAILFIANIGRRELTGDDAETDYIRVDLAGKRTEKGFPARKRRVAIEVSSFEDNDGELKGSGNLLGVGDWIEGFFDTTTKTFSTDAAVLAVNGVEE